MEVCDLRKVLGVLGWVFGGMVFFPFYFHLLFQLNILQSLPSETEIYLEISLVMAVDRFCSHDVKEHRETTKRRKLFFFFSWAQFWLYFSTYGTHCRVLDYPFWSSEWGGNVVPSSGSCSSKEVVVLNKPSVIFSMIEDNDGPFIFLNVSFHALDIEVIDVYSHNLDWNDLFCIQ